MCSDIVDAGSYGTAPPNVSPENRRDTDAIGAMNIERNILDKNKPQTGLRPPQQRSQRNRDLSILYCQIDELKPDPANPRRHSTKQVRQIANSIDTFGFNVPVLRIATGMSSQAMAGCLPPRSLAGARSRRCASITSPGRRPAPS